jgi:hypothetical protein
MTDASKIPQGKGNQSTRRSAASAVVKAATQSAGRLTMRMAGHLCARRQDGEDDTSVLLVTLPLGDAHGQA